jgi:hypothetical protein
MRITIDIKTDNAAFQDNDTELYDIMGRVSMAVSDGEREGRLMDSNGNKVGNFKVTGK